MKAWAWSFCADTEKRGSVKEIFNTLLTGGIFEETKCLWLRFRNVSEY